MAFTPTVEQQQIIDAFRTGTNLVIQAGAGTGKTSTLRLISQVAREKGQSGLYIAFNKTVAVEAGKSFPSNVKASTAHGLAFRSVGRTYAHRLNAPRQWPRQTARLLGLSPMSMKVYGDENRTFSAEALSKMVMNAISGFCRSADTEVTTRHFPIIEGLDAPGPRGAVRGPVHNRLAEHLLPFATRAWADLTNTQGTIRFEHDHYLKMYQLGNPVIDADFLLLDEAQDANPVIAAIVEAQTHLQVILVGDSAQAIYGFTGAVDAMAKFAAKGTPVRTLSQSFRFGPVVAETANVFLDALDAPLRLSGFDQVPSRRAALDLPAGAAADAILCRTNAGCLSELIAAQEQGRKAALVGGTKQAVSFVKAAQALKQGETVDHADLSAFTSWDLVEQYVNEEETTGDFARMVKLVIEHGCEPLLKVLEAADDEANAEVIISTAHKAKGREWDNVRISGDFSLDVEKAIAPADLMLAYVAVTRAKVTLDTGSLTTWLADQGALLREIADMDEREILEAIAAIEAEDVMVSDSMEPVRTFFTGPPAVREAQTATRHFVVDMTDPAAPIVGQGYTYADDCERWIAERGTDGHTYRVGTATIVTSPVVLL